MCLQVRDALTVGSISLFMRKIELLSHVMAQPAAQVAKVQEPAAAPGGSVHAVRTRALAFAAAAPLTATVLKFAIRWHSGGSEETEMQMLSTQASISP